MQHKFYILQQCAYSCILGLDFLQKQRANISFEDRTISLQGGITKVPLNPPDLDPDHMLRVLQPVTIPAQSISRVPVIANNCETDQLAIIHPHYSLPTNHCLTAATCVSQIMNGRTVCLLTNPTHRPVKLHPSHCIATFTPVQTSEISPPLADTALCSFDEMSDTEHDKYKLIAKGLGIQLEDSCLSPAEQERLLVFLGQNRDVFAKDIFELEVCDLFPHK